MLSSRSSYPLPATVVRSFALQTSHIDDPFAARRFTIGCAATASCAQTCSGFGITINPKRLDGSMESECGQIDRVKVQGLNIVVDLTGS